MKLFIDTSNSEKIIIGLDKKRLESPAHQKADQALLPFIVETLKKNKKNIKDITEIEVVQGPGSFTGLRVGLSVANAIGWALDVPVNGKNISKSGPITPVYK